MNPNAFLEHLWLQPLAISHSSSDGLSWGGGTGAACPQATHSLPEAPLGQPTPPTPPHPTLRGSGRRAGVGRPSNCPQVYSLPSAITGLRGVCFLLSPAPQPPEPARNLLASPSRTKVCSERQPDTQILTHTHTHTLCSERQPDTDTDTHTSRREGRRVGELAFPGYTQVTLWGPLDHLNRLHRGLLVSTEPPPGEELRLRKRERKRLLGVYLTPESP